MELGSESERIKYHREVEAAKLDILEGFEEELLSAFQCADEFTTSDLQGFVGAFVRRVFDTGLRISGNDALAIEKAKAKAAVEKAFAKLPMHTKDSDCTVDPETGCCKECGVDHSGQCPACNGRGFHNPGCPNDLDTEAYSAACDERSYGDPHQGE